MIIELSRFADNSILVVKTLFIHALRNKMITPHPPPRRSPFPSRGRLVLASPSGLRVSGGHLCEAEATTEPGGEKSCHEVTDEG